MLHGFLQNRKAALLWILCWKDPDSLPPAEKQLLSRIQEALEEGELKSDKTVEAIFITLCSGIHGLSLVFGASAMDTEEKIKIANTVIQTLIQGIGGKL